MLRLAGLAFLALEVLFAFIAGGRWRDGKQDGAIAWLCGATVLAGLAAGCLS